MSGGAFQHLKKKPAGSKAMANALSEVCFIHWKMSRTKLVLRKEVV
jgi:hypothetical protein